MPSDFAATAEVPTASGSRYHQQLCKHWSHKFEVNFDALAGHIELPMGTVDLAAHATTLDLTLTVNAGGDIGRMQQVVAEHLGRFAFREGELVYDWKLAT